jgi:hypothetical protein
VTLDVHFDFGNKIMLLLSIHMKMKIKLKGAVFWDVIPHNPVKVNQHFGGTCHLHLQGQSVCPKSFFDLFQITPYYTADDCALHSHH